MVDLVHRVRLLAEPPRDLLEVEVLDVAEAEHLLLELGQAVDEAVEAALGLELVGRLGGGLAEPVLELDLVDLARREVLLRPST